MPEPTTLRADCGCEIGISDPEKARKLNVWHFKHKVCPLHAAALNLLKACKGINAWLDEEALCIPEPQMARLRPSIRLLESAITKAEP